MRSETPEDDKIRKSSIKVRRIHNALTKNMPVEVMESLLQTEGNVNYDISEECDLQPNLVSPYFHYHNPACFDLLLKYGVDFVRKNKQGKTVLHQHIDFNPSNVSLLRLAGNFKYEFASAILSAHVKYNVTKNPRDDNGISHFHVACIMNNTSVVKFFLDNGVDVNQAVNANSLVFPLDTPLHLAAKYASAESMEILLEYGANVSLKNGDGMTPVHLLVDICKGKLKSLASYERTLTVLLNFEISEANDVDEFGFFKLHAACILEDEYLVESLLEKTENINQAFNSDSPICSGYSALHFAAHSKIEIFELLVKKGADIGAKNGRGMTPIDMFLQKYGAAGMHSILSLRNKWQNIVLSDNNTKLTEVVSAMKTPDEFISFLNSNKSAMTLIVPLDSPLWPGYTLLHLAVIFTTEEPYDPTIIAECLQQGADITTADVKGSTPLHLAFYMGKRRVVEYLLNHHDKSVNPVDAANLSHFHIACASRHTKTIKHFLSLGVNVNSPVLQTFDWIVEQVSRFTGQPEFKRFFICPGSTALHINVASGDVEITRLLLQHGADVQAKDANGFTPVHRLITSTVTKSLEDMTDLLLSSENLENSVAKGGLSHLHVACHFDHSMAVEKLIGTGADVNAEVTYEGRSKKLYKDDSFDPYGDYDEPLNFLLVYRNYTPLHFAGTADVTCLLVEAGADFSKRAADGTCNFYKLTSESIYQAHHPIFPILKKSYVIREHFERKFGWTKLHIACCISDLELIKKSMSCVNAKIHSDSPIWKGYTPLHVTAEMAFRSENGRGFAENSKKIVRLLIKNGANLTLQDDNGDTPLHLHSLDVTPFLSFLFYCLKDYKVNPTNNQGTSLFHIACATRNVRAVEKFLKHCVDVNQRANYFSACWSPGGTPLNLIMWNNENVRSSKRFLYKIGLGDDSIVRVVDKLIQHGADVNAIDAFGETPLFGVMRLKNFRRILIQKLISNGADVRVTNAYGNTAFELLLRGREFFVWDEKENVTWEEIELFLNAGCHLNSFNPVTQVGYMAELFHRHPTMKRQIRLKIKDHPQLTEINNAGRTAIHNIVSISASNSDVHTSEMIDKLTIRGCDVDHRDDKGKTALHLAVNMGNSGDIPALLNNGADVNLTADDGKTCITYACEDSEKFWDPHEVLMIFAAHLYKLEYCGLPMNEQNKRLYVELLEKYPVRIFMKR